MKKVTIFLMAVALALTLLGCAASQVQKATTPEQSSVPTSAPTTAAPTTAAPTTTPTTVPPTSSGWEILVIVLEKDGFDMALEKFYEDEENEYKFAAIMSPWVTVYYRNGTTENIVDAINAGRATLADLTRFGFSYYVVSKKDGSMSTVWGAQN